MLKNIRLFGFLAFTSLIFSACATSEKEEVLDMEKVRIEIQAMEDAYAAGEKAKDADAVAAYYSDDAISYSRNRQPLSGKAAIRDNIANNIAKDTTENYNVYRVVDLFAEGNFAVEIGSWTEFDSSNKEIASRITSSKLSCPPKLNIGIKNCFVLGVTIVRTESLVGLPNGPF